MEPVTRASVRQWPRCATKQPATKLPAVPLEKRAKLLPANSRTVARWRGGARALNGVSICAPRLAYG